MKAPLSLTATQLGRAKKLHALEISGDDGERHNAAEKLTRLLNLHGLNRFDIGICYEDPFEVISRDIAIPIYPRERLSDSQVDQIIAHVLNTAQSSGKAITIFWSDEEGLNPNLLMFNVYSMRINFDQLRQTLFREAAQHLKGLKRMDNIVLEAG